MRQRRQRLLLWVAALMLTGISVTGGFYFIRDAANRAAELKMYVRDAAVAQDGFASLVLDVDNGLADGVLRVFVRTPDGEVVLSQSVITRDVIGKNSETAILKIGRDQAIPGSVRLQVAKGDTLRLAKGTERPIAEYISAGVDRDVHFIVAKFESHR